MARRVGRRRWCRRRGGSGRWCRGRGRRRFWSWCRGRSWRRSRRSTASRELERADARAPVEAGRRCVILVRVPERAVVNRIDRQRAVIAPATARTRLTASAGEQRRFTLPQRVDRIRREPSRITDLRENRPARSAVTNRQAAVVVHRRATHPTPGRVRLISALLRDRYWTTGHVSQFKPAYARNTVRTHGVVANHRFVIAEVAIRQPEHQAVANSIQPRRRA